MQKLFFLFLFIGGSLFSQRGTCKVTKRSPDTKTKITFRFVSPSGKPASSHLAFKMNGDTIIQPKIDKKTGLYVMTLQPGKYNFNFYVKFWYDVNSAPIILKPKTNTFVVVKFEAKEIGGESVN
jgi:hypothetical protein